MDEQTQNQQNKAVLPLDEYLSLNQFGEGDQDTDNPEQESEERPIIKRAEDSIQVKLPNGFEIGLSSTNKPIEALCDLSLFMIHELNQNGKEKPHNKYIG